MLSQLLVGLDRAVGNETFDVFVSYARADWRHAADIDSVLRGRGLKPFFDRRNLPPGLPWVRELEKALNAAKAAIILIGPHGLGNTQQYERDLALYRQTRDKSFPIVPVILPEAEIDRPFNFLQILTWIDFSHVAKVSDAPGELERLVAVLQGASVESVQQAICPYRGLDAFREEDSLFFFGRGTADDPQSAIGQLVRKVREHPFVMVIGRSGSGKSSLVYAGLLPALRRARDRFWNVLTLRPGSEPIEALAIAFNPQADGEGSAKYAARIGEETYQLRTGDPELLSRMIRRELDRSEGKPDRLLLYIDQWEELYAQAPSPSVEKDRAARHIADVNRFIDLLLNASQSAPVSVVATVRADFYDPLISHQKIQALLPTQQVLLGAMSRADLESTIVRPAKMVGLTFDPPKLVSQILDEAGEDEGMLPLLQYALEETWKLREGSAMTGDSYAHSGGVREAIRLRAEQTYNDLSPDDQQASRKLFLRLVTPGEGQEDTRARAAMPDEPALRKIVDQFAGPRTRLLVTDRPTGSEPAARPTVEVAHEALIRTWPRLREWVDANRDKLRARQAILQSKAEWERNGRRQDLLLQGFQLERARLLLADPGDIAIDDIKEFVAESEAADATRRAEEEAREQQHQAAAALAAASRRVARRTLAGLAAALVLVVIATGMGIYARSQTNYARSQTAEAVRQKAEAVLQRAEAERQGAEAVHQRAEAEKQAALAEANFREGQRLESRLRAEQAKLAGADVVTAALLALEGLRDQTSSDYAQRTRPFVNEAWQVLYRAHLEQRERAILSHTDLVRSAVFAPDGRRILTASWDHTARLWDRDGKPLAILEGHTNGVTSAVFAPDGGRILTASDDKTARLWDRDGKPLAVLQGHTGPVSSAVFAPDGGLILTASWDNTARLWDRDGKPLAILEGHTGPIRSAVFAPDGGRILTASDDKTARLWDRDGKPLAILEGHTGPVNSAVFAPDGGRILTTSSDNTARLWDRDGKPLTVLEGHTGRVDSTVFAPDGGRILTASSDNTARLWEAFPKLQSFVDRVKAEVPRCLTTEQRQRLFLGPTLPSWCAALHKWPYDGATLSGSPAQSQAQKTAAPTANAAKDAQASESILNCEGKRILDPFKGGLAGPYLPLGLLPIDGKVKDSILTLRIPCQENVTPGSQGDPAGNEGVGLENLQRGFDFYSWRTFIALNAPVDGTSIEHAQARTPTKWEQTDNFKQLLDVMLPAMLQPPKWRTDRAGIEVERARLVPDQCRDLHKQMPQRMIVKMIEENFNEQFKAGPLIDQQGNYAIFDILMNRTMFDYILAHHLNTKAGQMSAANSGLLVDFPVGQNATSTLGAFMLKVSWKILSQSEINARDFHMVDALVLMPVDPRMPAAEREAKRPCLPETLGLIGFHAVHKTVSRPQWIWTSFEHIKNVPDKDQVATRAFDGPYSFFSVNCKDDCPEVNATPPRQFWQPKYALQLSFEDGKFRSQIVRDTPLGHATANMNKIFQSMLQDSVWKNYMLVNTQWPTAFVNHCTGLHSRSPAPAPNTDFLKQPSMNCLPAPSFMANSTLETYTQGEIPQASSSCIGCHGNAVGFQTGASSQKPGEVRLNQSDFTFMLEKAQ